MNISQDTFNKLVTITLLIYFMMIYTLSFILNKPLDIPSLMGFFFPLLAHGSTAIFPKSANAQKLPASVHES